VRNLLIFVCKLDFVSILSPTFPLDSKETWLGNFRVSGFQSFRVSGFQGFRVSGFQGFRVSGFKRLYRLSTL
jgi:hypothetical protein